MEMTITIVPNDKGNPPGKLADAELRFALCPDCAAAPSRSFMERREAPCTCGPLAGLKLIGFGIWERRLGHDRNVTFPARQYSVNGERRAFALLRPVTDVHAQERMRARILEAYAAYEAGQRDEAQAV